MKWSASEQRLRTALVESMIPAPGNGLPSMAELDLSSFWARFDAVAPLALALGLRTATLVIGGALPRAMGFWRGLDRLSPDERERVLRRARSLPLMTDLVEVAKIVACLAYFDDDRVQNRVRGSRE